MSLAVSALLAVGLAHGAGCDLRGLVDEVTQLVRSGLVSATGWPITDALR